LSRKLAIQSPLISMYIIEIDGPAVHCEWLQCRKSVHKYIWNTEFARTFLVHPWRRYKVNENGYSAVRTQEINKRMQLVPVTCYIIMTIINESRALICDYSWLLKAFASVIQLANIFLIINSGETNGHFRDPAYTTPHVV
jgi:hypothetical protein